jgi:pimeloyl-ACP methyl ester carboxylesterase
MRKWNDRRATIDGVETHYIESMPPQRDDSTAPLETLVLIHGGGVASCAELNYGEVMPYLGHRHRVIAPDVVGFGATPGRVPDDFSEVAQGDFVVRFVESLGTRVHIGGNSAGGWLAMYVALARPDLVASLTIINSGSVTVAERSDDDESRYDPAWAVPEGPPTLEEVRRQLQTFYVDQRLVTEERVRRTHEITLRNHAFARQRQGAQGRTSVDRNRRLLLRGKHISAYVGELNMPVLLTWSRENRAGSPEAALSFFNRLERGEMTVFIAAGHHVQTEHAERWSNVVASFLGANPIAASD